MRFFPHHTMSLSLAVACCFISLGAYSQNEKSEIDKLVGLSMEELMSVEVITASNTSEKLNKAPATIIVITASDIKERGYLELFDVLNDLPGFDLSRAFGDDEYYAYVRGYRKTTSDQMLLMIDGIIMNHLYNNNMNAYSQYPLQNIKQIEVVYGPASAIYGPNAFTGVINLITKDSGQSKVQAVVGQNSTNIVDLHLTGGTDDVTLNLSGRLYQSDGPDLEGRTPMLKNDLFTNPYYWGDYQQTDFIGYKSPIASHYFNANVNTGGLTVGIINFMHESGLGSEFAGGTTLNSVTWQFKENTVYGKYTFTKDKLSSKTLIKYRRSDIPGSSGFGYRLLSEAANTFTMVPGAMYIANQQDTVTNTTASNQSYVVDVNSQYGEYWQATNASYSFFQDFRYELNEEFTINFGLRYKRRLLNRDYIINSNEVSREYIYLSSDVMRENPLNPAVIGSFPFPDRPDDVTLSQENHNTIDDRGAYAQVQYTPTPELTLFGGLRYDYNSVWKEVLSPRVGVVYEFVDGLTAKAFFGTAFLEPSARVLYGGWQGTFSNDQLVPEKMRTFEVSASYTKGDYSLGINGFFNSAPDAISQNGTQPLNLGERRMMGLEMNAKALLRPEGNLLTKFKGDLYVSLINSEEDLANSGTFEETGNMAPLKVKAIFTGYLKERLSISLQNRYIAQINTVTSNPIRTIDSYFVSDLYLNYDDVLIEGLSMGLKVYNILNEDYFHPGYRGADAGEVSVNHALFNTSWYSSRLPQPERYFLITMGFDF